MANANVGKSTAGDRIKRAHKTSGAKADGLSLRAFVRRVLKEKDKDHEQNAKDWLEAKDGALNLKKSEMNQKRIVAERTATKLSRKGKK